MPLVLVARLLLLAPYLILSRPRAVREKSNEKSNAQENVHREFGTVYQMIAVVATVLMALPAFTSAIRHGNLPFQPLAQVLLSYHAVGAVGFDLIIGAASYVVSYKSLGMAG